MRGKASALLLLLWIGCQAGAVSQVPHPDGGVSAGDVSTDAAFDGGVPDAAESDAGDADAGDADAGDAGFADAGDAGISDANVADSGPGDASADAGGDAVPDGGRDAGLDAGLDAGTNEGPFVDFTVWRAACGHELWGRWTTGETITLTGYTTHLPNGTLSQHGFSDPERLGQHSMLLLEDLGNLAVGGYSFDFSWTNSASATVNLTLHRTVDATISRGDGVLSLVSARNDATKGLALTVVPSLNGSLQREEKYSGADDCSDGNAMAGNQLMSGTATEAIVGGHYASGTKVLVSFWGRSSDTNQLFYTALDVTTP